MKTRITFLLCALLLCSMLGWGQTWQLTETMAATLANGTLTISTTKSAEAMPDYDYAASPWYSVRSKILSAVVRDGVTSIGTSAFSECTNLNSVNIPNSVVTIGVNAFRLTSLTSVTIPNSVTEIGELAFGECSLTSVVIPNSVTAIGWGAFLGSGLTSVIIPNSITAIEKLVFAGCSSLTSAVIPNSVTEIREDAFLGCSSLTSVVIPNSVTEIREDAFLGCSSLTSVVIPNSVTTIRYRAFSNCSSLTSVVISNSVKTIEKGVFGNCSSLASVTIPNSVTTIGESAFFRCSSLTSVTIPNSMKVIEKEAFWLCSSLTSVTIPNSVTTVGEDAFAGCSSLASVAISNSMKVIGRRVFAECSSLTSVTIPNSVTEIGAGIWGYGLFENCSNLTSVTVQWTEPLNVPTNTFKSVDASQCTLNVPPGTKALYEAASVWEDFKMIKEQGASAVETKPVTTGNTGSMELSLYLPTGSTLTGSFGIQFPAGMELDTVNTKLSGALANNFGLGFHALSDSIWTVEVKNKPGTRSLRSTANYTKVMNIAYTVAKSIEKGTYMVELKDLHFTLSDGSTIEETNLPVTIQVERTGTGTEAVDAANIKAYFHYSILYVSSPTAETVEVYSFSGRRIFSARKDAGEATFTVPTNLEAVIVRGSSGWVQKAVVSNN